MVGSPPSYITEPETTGWWVRPHPETTGWWVRLHPIFQVFIITHHSCSHTWLCKSSLHSIHKGGLKPHQLHLFYNFYSDYEITRIDDWEMCHLFCHVSTSHHLGLHLQCYYNSYNLYFYFFPIYLVYLNLD